MNSFRDFKMIFMKLLDKFVTLKREYLRANYSKFMTKELGKVIEPRRFNEVQLRTKLRSQFLIKDIRS